MIWKNLEVKKQFIRYLQCRIRKADSLQMLHFMQELIRTQSNLSFLQVLYSEEVLSGKGIELEDRREASNIRFPQGVSIYKKELEKRMRSLSRQDQKQIKTIQEEVKTVRFYSIWDRELNSLLSKYEAQEDEKQKEHVFTETIQKWKEKIQK